MDYEIWWRRGRSARRQRWVLAFCSPNPTYPSLPHPFSFDVQPTALLDFCGVLKFLIASQEGRGSGGRGGGWERASGNKQPAVLLFGLRASGWVVRTCESGVAAISKRNSCSNSSGGLSAICMMLLLAAVEGFWRV